MRGHGVHVALIFHKVTFSCGIFVFSPTIWWYHIIVREVMEDTFRHKGLRKKMVEDLLARVEIEGLDRQAVLEKKRQVCRAIEEVPRHCFIDTAFDSFAYQDRAFPIGDGQTISQPSTVLAQTVLLDVTPGDKILEVGTGSGYQAMVLE
ncbi:MAG: hypothetical protein K2K51_05735, partial [Bacteroidales bacterium]|nr:hypothetical protein [Bacteroidales bacterium]